MYRLIMFVVAMTLAIIATLVFIAGNQLEQLSGDSTRLIGTGFFMFSGLFWCLFFAFAFKNQEATENK